MPARDSLDTLEALGFPALALAPATAELVALNGAAARLLGVSAPGAWLDGVHPGDRAALEHACRTHASRAEFRGTSDHLKFRRFQIELRPQGDVTLGLLVDTIAESSSEPELAALIEALPFEVWQRDASGVLVRQNSTALRNRGARLGTGIDAMGMSNSITNAVQAMPDRGKLTVTLSELEHERKGTVAIAVQDTGRGIPSDVLPRVFEPFFTTRASGAGLGLAVVRRIVEAHDGLVSARSDDGGTVFTVLIPR